MALPRPDETWEPWPGPHDDLHIAYLAIEDGREVARRFMAGFQGLVQSAIASVPADQWLGKPGSPHLAWTANAWSEAFEEGRASAYIHLEKGHFRIDIEVEEDPRKKLKLQIEDLHLTDVSWDLSW